MLYLLFTRCGSKSALAAKDIVEIIPMVEIRSLPSTPDYIAGKINYRGSSVVLIDLEAQNDGCHFNEALSTRIIILQHEENIFGVIAQDVTDTLEISEKDFLHEGCDLKGIDCQKNARIADEIIACYSAYDLLPSKTLHHSNFNQEAE